MTNGVVQKIIDATFAVLTPHSNPVYLGAPTIMGTGFFINRDGFFITARHVLEKDDDSLHDPAQIIFQKPLPGPMVKEISLVQDWTRYDLVLLKAYIDYIDSTAITPHSSMIIDPSEARSLLLFISQKASYEVMPQAGSMMGEWYSFHIVLSGIGYGINIMFSNERPVLD